MPLVEKLGEEFTDDRLIKELDLMLDNSRKGSSDHRENIKFIMALLNKLPETLNPGKGKKNMAVEIDYSEVQPPQLGQAEKKKENG